MIFNDLDMNAVNRISLFLLFFGCAVQTISAQDVRINEEPRVAQLMDNWVSNNRSDSRIDGWRVQIMASTDRTQVELGRTRFRTENPEVAATTVQEQPYYKLRVGAFRSKQEALVFISTLDGWAGAYPAKDPNIHPRDFLEQ
jgi:hypothetical protein